MHGKNLFCNDRDGDQQVALFLPDAVEASLGRLRNYLLHTIAQTWPACSQVCA